MFTKFDRDMYNILKFIDSYINAESLDQVSPKYKIKFKEDYYYFVLSEAVNNNYVDGIKSVSATFYNTKKAVFSKNIYITQKGYAFMKKYKYRMWPTIKTILIVVVTALVTAIITVLVNNWFGEKSENCICNYISQPNSKQYQ